MRCSICGHGNQKAIEEALRAKSIAEVAAQFGCNENALTRHEKQQHPRAASNTNIPASPAVRKTMPPAAVESSPPPTVRSERKESTAREKAREIAKTIDALLLDAETNELATLTDKASLVRAALAANRQYAQLTGEIGASESVIASSPHYRRIRTVIVEALRDFHDARASVIAALEREERGSAGTTEAAAE